MTQQGGPGFQSVLRGAVFDIDGTLALAGKDKALALLPGAREVISDLIDAGVPICAFTNGSFKTSGQYQEALARIGLQFPVERVLTPITVAIEVFSARSIRRILVLGVDSVCSPLTTAGFDVVRPGESLDGVEAVLIGWFPDFGLSSLESACNAVEAGAALYSVSNAPYFASQGGRMLGISGAIGAMVTSVTGKQPEILGKPSVLGLEVACRRMGLPASDVAVIGDDPSLEIVMARDGGACAIGVATGISDRASFLAGSADRLPHYVFSSMTELRQSEMFRLFDRTNATVEASTRLA